MKITRCTAPISASLLLIVAWGSQAQVLQAGDASEDYEFNSSDLVQVFAAGRYRTANTAKWADGDWNGAPGGSAGSPPSGDDLFDEFDVVAAFYTGLYETGSYIGRGPTEPAPLPAPVLGGGRTGDNQTSLIYDALTGEVSVDPPGRDDLTTIHLISRTGIFDGSQVPAGTLPGLFDVAQDDSIFKLEPGGFGAISLGTIAPPGLTEGQFRTDVSVHGSLGGGGGLGAVDLVFVAAPDLQAGDANEDYEFNSSDLVLVFASGLYKSAGPANWSEGDWDGAPGGFAGSPPPGDGFFDEIDIVAAYHTGLYETGSYVGRGPSVSAPGPAPVLGGGVLGDAQASLVYDTFTGEVSVDPPAGVTLTTIHLISATGFFDATQLAPQTLTGLFDVAQDESIFKLEPEGFGAISLGTIAPPGLTDAEFQADVSVHGSLSGGGSLGAVDLVFIDAPVLQAGDANEDYEFNAADLVLAFAAGRYKTTGPAAWAEGDWDGAPGGSAGSPPVGDGLFDEVDLVAAFVTGLYETGSYARLGPAEPAPEPAPLVAGGMPGDAQTSLHYDRETGEVRVDPPAGVTLTTIHLISATGFFDGLQVPPGTLTGLFDVAQDDSIFKLEPDGFGAISLGTIAPPGLTDAEFRADISVHGSLSGGGSLGDVDLIGPAIFLDGFEDAVPVKTLWQKILGAAGNSD